jgi:hypothetical protein
VQVPASLNSKNPNIDVGSLMGVGGSKVDVNRKSGVGGVVVDCGHCAPVAAPPVEGTQTCVFRAQLPFKLASGIHDVFWKGVPSTKFLKSPVEIELLVTIGVES